MIYSELLGDILTELQAVITFKNEPEQIRKIQEYVEAYEEFESIAIVGGLQNNIVDSSFAKNPNGTSKHETNIHNYSDSRSSSSSSPSLFRLEIMQQSEKAVDTVPKGVSCKEFNNKVIMFLNSIISSFLDGNNYGLTNQETLFMIGSVYAILGKCYSNGLLDVAKSKSKAMEYLKKSTSCKSPMGTFELARCYDIFHESQYDPEHAAQLYRVSYKLGYVRGLHKYAKMLIKGTPFVEKNIMNGYYILKQAFTISNNIFIHTYYDLGMLYTSGICDIFNDYKYAFEIFKAGARKGCKFCQFKLGEEYETGKIVSKHLETAFYWYRMSAMNSFVDGQHKVATILYGIKNVGKEDIAEALDNRGVINGKVVLVSFKGKEKMRGFTDLEMAFHKQNRKINFERIYGIRFDRYKEAFRMARNAAIGGKKEAVLLVAEALEKGFGVEKDISESIWWYDLADTLGCENVREKKNILEGQVLRNTMNYNKFK